MAKADITEHRLRETLYYDPETGVFTWLKPTSNRVKLGRVAGNLTSHGYIEIGISTVRYYGHRLAWLYVYGCFPADELDHVDGNRSNNRISNLREATHKQNMENRGPSIRNTSGVKGVYWHKNNNNWFATIRANGAIRHIGCFKSIEEAKYAREQAERIHFTHSPACATQT